MARTVMDLFEASARTHGMRPAIWSRVDGRWRPTTWGAYRDEVRTTARAFVALGVEPGQGVSILGANSGGWFISNLAAIYAGGVPTGIYTTSSPEQCRYILGHSDSSLIVVESEAELQKILSIRAELPALRNIVLMRGRAEGAVAWSDLAGIAEKVSNEELDRRIERQRPEDICTLIYTSGTTAEPKAAMLTHENLTFTASTISHQVDGRTSDRVLSYLPLSHIAEQIISLYSPMVVGCSSYFCPSTDQLGDFLREVRPTMFIGVPRVWEKIQAKMMAAGAASPWYRKRIAAFARNIGRAAGQADERAEPRPFLYPFAKRLVFDTVRGKLGFDECRLQVTTAAPIARETLDFFMSLGIPLYEFYGMTECSGPATVSLPNRFRVGKVGRVIAGTEAKVANDGELCLRGAHIFAGYKKDATATEEAFDAEGWLRTGDIGTIDADGYIQITDRKKEIIITAGGKNVTPQAIESKLVGIAAVAQAVVIGDRRPYLTALLTLDPEKLPSCAEAAQSKARTPEEAAACPRFKAYLEAQIDAVNKTLARVQTIKKFRILPREFTIDGGELTHTMKLKRRIIATRYASEIESLYAE